MLLIINKKPYHQPKQTCECDRSFDKHAARHSLTSSNNDLVKIEL